MKLSEQQRLWTITEYERHYWDQGVVVGGMDEVGRGPLAGPVVCACVVLPAGTLIEGIKDSKKVSPARRLQLNEEIRERATACGLGQADHEEIDSINILNATKRAFERAYAQTEKKPGILLIDAVSGLDIPAKQIPIIKGDDKSYLIGAASIVAKVYRDALMIEYDAQYPQYGFAQNKGYGTKSHIEALRRHGPCPLHRRTFIRNYV